jgi:hypothetical protein
MSQDNPEVPDPLYWWGSWSLVSKLPDGGRVAASKGLLKAYASAFEKLPASPKRYLLGEEAIATERGRREERLGQFCADAYDLIAGELLRAALLSQEDIMGQHLPAQPVLKHLPHPPAPRSVTIDPIQVVVSDAAISSRLTFPDEWPRRRSSSDEPIGHNRMPYAYLRFLDRMTLPRRLYFEGELLLKATTPLLPVPATRAQFVEALQACIARGRKTGSSLKTKAEFYRKLKINSADYYRWERGDELRAPGHKERIEDEIRRLSDLQTTPRPPILLLH